MDRSDEKLVLEGLFDEFETEKKALEVKLSENNERLEIIENNIDDLKVLDDDRQMFSPRNINNINQDKINELMEEKNELMEENKYVRSRLAYFSEKTDALGNVINENNDIDIEKLNSSLENIETENSTDDIDFAALNEYITDPQKMELDSKIKSFMESTSDIVINRFEIENMINKLNLTKQFMTLDINRSKLEVDSIISTLNEYLNE